jgi:hypothetical protein
MTFTLSLPTWNTIKAIFLVIVAYYGVIVAPQYDWIVFGVVYWFGICIALRSAYRMPNTHKTRGSCCTRTCPCTKLEDGRVLHNHNDGYKALGVIATIAWPLIIPLGLTYFIATFGNSPNAKD